MRTIFDTKLIVFQDTENQDSYYGMTQEEVEHKVKLMRQYGKTYEREMPTDLTIKARPMVSTGEINKQGMSVSNENKDVLIDFPIYRIHWVLLRIMN
jgi:hypothetical protein